MHSELSSARTVMIGVMAMTMTLHISGPLTGCGDSESHDTLQQSGSSDGQRGAAGSGAQ